MIGCFLNVLCWIVLKIIIGGYVDAILGVACLNVLEKAIDKMEEELPMLRAFILPSGHPTVSKCHIARTVCRRAERNLVALSQEEQIDNLHIQYLNRLSDYLFVLARAILKDNNAQEIEWQKD